MCESNNFLKDNGFSQEIQNRFSEMGTEVNIEKGEKILEQGKVCSFIAIIKSGLFKTYHDYEGKESTIGLKYAGFITDYSSFITKTPSEVNIVAYSNAKLIYFEKEEIETFFEYSIETERFGRKIAEQLMVSNQRNLFSLMYDSAEKRYNNIFKLCPEIFQLFPLKDIGNCIGVTPETISRIRKKTVKY